MSDKFYILYDKRARGGDTDDATILSTANSEGETHLDRRQKREFDGVWFEYDDVDGKLLNPKQRDDL